MNAARCKAYTPASSSSVSCAGQMYAEVCFMSFFEGTARVEFIDVVAMIIVLVYRQISYAIVS